MEIINRYFPDLTDTQREQYLILQKFYHEWNQKVNVISRKDIDHLYLRHVLHSLAIGKYTRFSQNTKILDVGTGGGFPGIPLAILFPEADFLLVDSIGKKIRVVEEAIKATGIQNCEARKMRAEELDQQFDFVVSRAVTSMPVFIAWVRKLISKKSVNTVPNGILALKGGDLNDELSLPYKTKITELSEYFDESFFETKQLVHVLL